MVSDKIKIFGSDSRHDLECQINDFLASLTCDNVRIIQLVGDAGDEAYAVLVAWEE